MNCFFPRIHGYILNIVLPIVVLIGRSGLVVILRMATLLHRGAVILRLNNHFTGALCQLKCDIISAHSVRRHHVARGANGSPLSRRLEFSRNILGNTKHKQSSAVLGSVAVRLASTNFYVDDSQSTGNTLDAIPEPPAIPLGDQLIETVQVVVGEPSFVSQGLGGWSPVGIVQHCMEYLHIGCDLPWWTTIMIGTIVVRTIIFPLVIVAQRNAAKMNNNLPQLQLLQLKMTEARQSGNQLDAARYGQEMMLFMKEKQLNPLKNMLVPLAQAPLFISFFMGLRGMSNVPVESMMRGGLFWFEDLTMPDQFFILPVITSATMWLTIEIGTDSARLSAANMQMMKYVLRALPICILPFTVSFPGAILCYWVSTNFISLLQVGFLRIPSVREYFKIERLVTHSPDALPVKPKGFVKGMKDSWTNLKITKEIEDRKRFDEMAFQRAGRGAIQKTFTYNPTEQRQGTTAQAKKKD